MRPSAISTVTAQYEVVLHQTGVAKDNSQPGVTDAPIFQAYKLDGTLLWTINLGRNVREGAHYTQFLVYDFDGDGRAEFVCKTADGTTDGTGKVLGDAKANWLTPESAGESPGSVTAPRREGTSGAGFILSGPEYLTVFDGLTGKALASETYLPRRHPTDRQPDARADEGNLGRRTRQPHRPFPRGRRLSRRRAPEHRDGARLLHTRRARGLGLLERQARRETRKAAGCSTATHRKRTSAFRGQGNHQLSVADVDGDGRDEIIYGAAVIDDDGKGLYSTGWGHGDALHVSDLDPANPGLEVFDIQERFGAGGHEPARCAHRQAVVHHSIGEGG